MLNFHQSIHFDSAVQKISAQSSLHNSFQKPHGKYLCSTIIGKHFTGIRGLKKNNVRASSTFQSGKFMATEDSAISINGIVTVDMAKPTDSTKKMIGIQLISTDLDPTTDLPKQLKAYASQNKDQHYEFYMEVPADFGEIGAVVVENENEKEVFFKHITLEGFIDGKKLTIVCESWVHSKFDNPFNRIFFTDKSYLPSETPGGLKLLREQDMEQKRGDGERVERKAFERIYDYDVYNDLGDPDNSPELARPVLGGPDHPYPRRGRTGRPPTKADPLTENRKGILFYVPRDEAFSAVKFATFASVMERLIPGAMDNAIEDDETGFPYFTEIDKLFNEGIHIPKVEGQEQKFSELMPRLVKLEPDGENETLLFETPELLDRDKWAWMKDEEFSRQTLAGINPYSIRLVKESEWPLRSSLNPEIYGSPESLITKELVECQMGGLMTVEEALKNKKLFMLDYHDFYLPYVNKVREIKGTTLYGSRTLFFLAKNGTLKPIAIELTRPPNEKDGKPQWKEVFTPGSSDGTNGWLWKLAKSHVAAHDAGHHQLISHWLRTHCCTEPYIIATNRQLSAVHPIYRLLDPHFRYTMELNAIGRKVLMNANGTTEKAFSTRKYSVTISSDVYDKEWRFDMEALPADLIRRGMAVEDPSAEHGLKLAIKDYPFANDGLILWDAIKTWVSDYVNHYYPESRLVETDTELQAWWTEIQTVGHGDKKDEPWWPNLKTPDDLIKILTTMIWVPSGSHSAVNFGQYNYAGYFPNRPTIARINLPNEDPTEEEFQNFLKRPENTLMKCFPSKAQAILVMTVLNVLSGHSPDEEYIGDKLEPAWEANPVIKMAFERFKEKVIGLEGVIDGRNADLNLKNRSGAGVIPYEILKPYSGPGVTGKGVPNSISI